MVNKQLVFIVGLIVLNVTCCPGAAHDHDGGELVVVRLCVCDVTARGGRSVGR